MLSNKYNDDGKNGLLNSIEAASNRVVQFANLFGDMEKVNIDGLTRDHHSPTPFWHNALFAAVT
jgi:hypothetical protein